MKTYIISLLLLSGTSSLFCMEMDIDAALDNSQTEESRLIDGNVESISELVASPGFKEFLTTSISHYKMLYQEEFERWRNLNDAGTDELEQCGRELECRKDAYFKALSLARYLRVQQSTHNIPFVVQATKDDPRKSWLWRRRYNMAQLSSCFIVGVGIGSMGLAMSLLIALNKMGCEC